MKMQALVALANFPYAKRSLKTGDTFQATPRDARILIALKRAQADPAGIPEIKSAVDTPEVELITEVMEMQAPRPRGRPRKTVGEGKT